MATTWVAGNRYLTQAEMENNAQMFYSRMTAYGFSLNAIAGMLGNIQTESGINPGIWESLDPFEGGYGLSQWTPYTNYSNWAGSGWENNGDKQCERINYEFANGLQYYPTESHPLTASQFRVSTASPADLAETFLYNYERPADPSGSVADRRSQATTWYNYLIGTVAYTPRLSMGDIYNSVYYTTADAYYPTYQMPNCTAYAYGRWNELCDYRVRHNRFPTGQGCDWYPQGVTLGFQTGMIPQLGAAACWWYEGEEDGQIVPTGHVAIVEQINYDSQGNPISFVTSNSAWNRDSGWDNPRNEFPWFYLETISMDNLNYRYGHPEAYFQGFLYNENISPVPPTPTPTGRRMPFIFYLKRIL